MPVTIASLRCHIDLTGYTWASADELIPLFNSYGITPPFTAPFQERLADQEEFCQDFETRFFSLGMGGGPFLAGIIRDERPPNGEAAGDAWASGVVHCRYFYNPDGPGNPDGFDELNILDFFSGGHLDYRGVWFWRQLEEVTFRLRLEEPIDGEIHSGIGSLRGWAISEEGIDRVEIYIDGKYVYDAPYGGSRSDVGAAYPDVDGSDNSGYSLAYGYSNLSDGEHTIMARAFDSNGDFVEDSSNFTVVGFDEPFIFSNEIVDIGDSAISAENDEIILEGVTVGDKVYDLKLKWRTAEQGFEIIEIR